MKIKSVSHTTHTYTLTLTSDELKAIASKVLADAFDNHPGKGYGPLADLMLQTLIAHEGNSTARCVADEYRGQLV